MPGKLIEAAFREARETAFCRFNTQLVRDGHEGPADHERYDRALIAAYISHPAVLEAAHRSLGRKEDTYAYMVLTAIGAGQER